MDTAAIIRSLELAMLLCFGASWPFSIAKLVKNKSTKGMSPIFLLLLIIGYVAGIIMKILRGDFVYVGIFYCVNLAMVCADFALYNIYRMKEKNRKFKLNLFRFRKRKQKNDEQQQEEQQ